MSLVGKVAIVTGASRGIGLASAHELHARGAHVVVTARTQDAAEEAAASIGEGARGFGAHAASEDSARACISAVMEEFGTVDILVNNAGTNPAFGKMVDQDVSRFTKTVDINLRAPLMWTSMVWEASMRKHGGSIVNTASTGGMFTVEDIGVYNVSKAALIHLTKQFAVELAPNVRVNAVAPGVVRTRLAEALWKEHEGRVASSIPLGRIGEPADIADAVCFLASDAARWITGQTLVIDGGQTLGHVETSLAVAP